MQIVDAQIHVWGSGLPSNLAHRQVTAFTTEEAIGLMLGHRHHEDAVFPAAVRDHVHRGAAVAVRGG
jgi:hypothetical protein